MATSGYTLGGGRKKWQPRRLRRMRLSAKPVASLDQDEVMLKCVESFKELSVSDRVAMCMLPYNHVNLIVAFPRISIATIIRLVHMGFLVCHEKTMVYWSQALLQRHGVPRRVCLSFESVAVQQRRDTTDMYAAQKNHHSY